ncbi:L2 [Tursiops truncatus papillomavirus 2]|uniref:Minor capsid protein L2 n=1 Tax=Tursiops truncatus papillomavirus 2 TaxID=936060 RepID=Q1XA70_9PAPI|nr:L2 [Tursiops truncatus papillomavirus 2]AAY32858.1 L2 [Tursiops truncatus papillomavirus 2]
MKAPRGPRVKRVKRASDVDLYKTCYTGDCIPDVQAKYEHSTVADKILKWFSSFLYFGDLGISTARGSSRLPAAVRPPSSRLPVGGRATVGPSRVGSIPASAAATPVDVIGPADVGPALESTPVVIDPSSPSVVTLSEGAPVSGTTTDLTRFSTSFPGLDAEAPAILDVSDFQGSLTRGDTFATEYELAAIPPDTPAIHSDIQLSTSVHSNPTYDSTVFSTGSTPLLGEGTSSGNMLVLHGLSGQHIGSPFEEIELQALDGSDAPVPRSSTPHSTIKAALSSGRRALLRIQKGVPWRLRPTPTPADLQFLVEPRPYIFFGTDNPVFQPDGAFGPLNTADPSAPFPQDIISLSEPEFAVRGTQVSLHRIGMRSSLRLRSGTQLGTRVHYYTDLSSIHAEEAIELSAIGNHSGDSVVVNPQAGNTTVDVSVQGSHTIDPLEGFSVLPDVDLLDSYSEDFGHAHLVLSSGKRRPVPMSFPELPVSHRFGIGPAPAYVHHSVSFDTDTTIPLGPPMHGPPNINVYSLDDTGGQFRFWHFLRKKRRRRYL